MTDHHPLSVHDFHKAIETISLAIVHIFQVASVLFPAAAYASDFQSGDIVAMSSSILLLAMIEFSSYILHFTDNDDAEQAVPMLFAAWVGFLAATSLWIYTLATAYWFGAAPSTSARKFVRRLAWAVVWY
ncbi:hypothetical protein GL218_08386 [Daldinia childiae]|uniref:uncharacterized protein n=1 Tax=Daldinia childiae TaxID=326645 RepID=UPI00144642B6|nr:uncharacterized protein GL218_08386 [Daldinia childiae]KAF3068493.1 hypothetical protein GL218_08386 [Daldinia childiae]